MPTTQVPRTGGLTEAAAAGGTTYTLPADSGVAPGVCHLGAVMLLPPSARASILHCMACDKFPLIPACHVNKWVDVSRDYITGYSPFERGLLLSHYKDIIYLIQHAHAKDVIIRSLRLRIAKQAQSRLDEAVAKLESGDKKRRRTANEVDAEQTAVFDALLEACETVSGPLAAAE